MDELKRQYQARKDEIGARLQEFRAMRSESEEKLFCELCFCLFTPQSKAVICDRAMSEINECGLLLNGTEAEVAGMMRGVRFKNQKAGYLVEARKKLLSGDEGLKQRVCGRPDNRKLREWLVKNVKGLGYKESSHFLRNVGLGRDLAILDRHILKSLVRFGVIDEVPKSLTRKRYYEIEERMREFSSAIGIGMEELDLLFWSMETGTVFK